MGPFIARTHTRTRTIEDLDVDDRVRFIGPIYLLNGMHHDRYDALVRQGQTGEIAHIENVHRVVVQWDHHRDGSEPRRGPQRIDRVCLEHE